MAKEYRSPGAGEGGCTQLEARQRSWDRPWSAPGAFALLLLGLQVACATGYPMGGTLAGTGRHGWQVRHARPTLEDGAGGARAAAAEKPGAPSDDLEAADADAEERETAGMEDVSAAEGGRAAGRPRRLARRASKADEQYLELEGKSVGWPDGVGDGRPFEVPMTLDYFQGFLGRAGVPSTAVPKDGRTPSSRGR